MREITKERIRTVVECVTVIFCVAVLSITSAFIILKLSSKTYVVRDLTTNKVYEISGHIGEGALKGYTEDGRKIYLSNFEIIEEK